eukprot:1191678-Prorocentrum_minimum.AAC.2
MEWINKVVLLRRELEGLQETAIRLDQQYVSTPEIYPPLLGILDSSRLFRRGSFIGLLEGEDCSHSL